MTIEKSRFRRGSRRGRGRDRRPGGRRDRGEKMRTAQEQLDYEMDLLRARRDGREEEFVREEREKLHAKRAANLDAEMDDYFSKKEEKLEQSTNGQKEETAAEGSEEKTESAPGESQRPSSSS